MLRRLVALLLVAASAAALPGCTTTARPSPTGSAPGAPAVESVDLPAVYSELGRTSGRVFRLAPQDSAVRMYAFRAGRAARLGHNHVLSAPQFIGFFHLPSGGAANGRFDLTFRLDQLEIDNPGQRGTLGAAFASAISPEDTVGTREHLLGEDGLQAGRFPLVHIRSLQISGEAPKFAVKVQIDMHGREQQMWIPLDVEGLPDRISVNGSFVLRQTDFGVQPYSLLGGLLSVQDEVVIEFKLTGACAPDLSSSC